MKKNLPLLLLLLTLSSARAQHTKIDSLLKLISIEKNDTSRAKVMNALCWEYGNIGEFEKALEYGNQALTFSKNHLATGNADLRKTFKRVWAAAYHNIGSAYHNQGVFDKALEYYRQGLLIRREIGIQSNIAWSLNNIGNVY